MNKKLYQWLVIILAAFIAGGCGGTYSHEVAEQYPDGTTKLIKYFKEDSEGKKLYKTEEFYDNGIKKMEGYYENGQRHGRWSSWFSNGNLWSVANYRSGNMHGKQTVYYPNGKKYYEGTFENGIRTGEWLFWNEDGTLVKRLTY